jgi:SAM-dependent methyltransferase
MKNFVSFLIRHIPRKYLQRISGPGLRFIGLFLLGKNVTCPICTKSFRKFLPYGRINPRPNALCPNCLSLERHRLIWLYLKEKTNFFNHKQHVLHIAPEGCFIYPFQEIHQDQYITADIESPLAKVKMDIHKIPFAPNTFDVVLCNHVLEHVQDDLKALEEIERVLKPKGFAILQVPFFHPVPEKTFSDPTITDRKTREKMFGQDDHVRKYGKDYPSRIERAGLKAIQEEFVNEIPESRLKKFGLVKGETIYKAESRKQKVEG